VRLGASMSGYFERADRVAVEYPMTLSRTDVDSLIAMGPSARHLGDEARAQRIAGLPETSIVTASVTISSYRPLPAAG